MRRGFTVLELALVLTIVGVALGIALPRLGALHDSIAVQHAAQTIISAHQRARIIAIKRSQTTLLTVAPDRLVIQLRGAAAASWEGAGPAAMGVLLEGPSRIVLFSPVGMSMGLSNATFRLTRGAATRTVVVSRLGRVRTAY